MSQAEVYQFLKKHKNDWFTAWEVSDSFLTKCPNNINRALRKLAEHKEIKRQERKTIDKQGRIHNLFVYSFK